MFFVFVFSIISFFERGFYLHMTKSSQAQMLALSSFVRRINKPADSTSPPLFDFPNQSPKLIYRLNGSTINKATNKRPILKRSGLFFLPNSQKRKRCACNRVRQVFDSVRAGPPI